MDESGADRWDFLSTFFAARRTFLSIYRRYERRVIRAARERGVSREELELPPKDLARLFTLKRLEALRDGRLAPLKELSQRLFAEEAGRGADELMDVYCSHVFHEMSILAEEHRSVGRFVRIQDRRRYSLLFQEVSRYYPVRLRRILRFFATGARRIDALLPEWSGDPVIVRSVYLFGDRLGRQAYGEGVEAVYRKMYRDGGAPRGFLEAAKSFEASGFLDRAREAANRALEPSATPSRKKPSAAVEKARREAKSLLRRLEAPGSVVPER